MHAMGFTKWPGDNWKDKKQNVIIFVRSLPSVVLKKRTALKTRLWTTKNAWYLAMVFMRMSQTSLCNKVWWKVGNLWICDTIYLSMSVFQKIVNKYGADDQLLQSLQGLFPSSSTDEEASFVSMLTEAYHNYKRKYVKHLTFSPEVEDLSKIISLK